MLLDVVDAGDAVDCRFDAPPHAVKVKTQRNATARAATRPVPGQVDMATRS
jgi:hypothetical protein